jgi:hypothetical protein
VIKYWKYLIYVLEHKKNVFIECWKKGLYTHAFTHDLSKFSPKEFKAYAWKFYGGKQASRALLKATGTEHICISQEDIEEAFTEAWKHHYTHNKHHWNYWIGQEMPIKYIEQMVCDWKGMARRFGDTAQEFYCKNYDKIQLEHNSRVNLEYELGLLGEAVIFNMTWKQLCEKQGKTIEEDLKELLSK